MFMSYEFLCARFLRDERKDREKGRAEDREAERKDTQAQLIPCF